MSDNLIVIVGAGPAGMEAALTLVRFGFRPVVIDAGAHSGGQIYRRVPDSHRRSYRAIYGFDAIKARYLHDAFDAICTAIDYRPKTRVWAVHEGELFLDGPDGCTTLTYDKLILCTGAIDQTFPVQGWEAKGCYSLGGAQIALKSQALALGNPIGFVGAGPLLWLVAWQHLKAGAEVAGVWCTSTRRDLFFALPWLVLRPRLALRGVRQIFALWRAKIPIQFGAQDIALRTDSEGAVTGLCWSDGYKKTDTPLRALALGWHLQSETQLSQLLEIPSVSGQHRPVIDSVGRSSTQDVYMAGDGVEILGSDAARTGGRMVATAVLDDLGIQKKRLDRLTALGDRVKHLWMRGFAKGLARAFPQPDAGYFLSLPESTIICRCEGVSIATVSTAVENWQCEDMNRLKAITRAGMGRCQGRYCSATLAAVVAARTGRTPAEILRYRAQAPIYPTSINLNACHAAKSDSR